MIFPKIGYLSWFKKNFEKVKYDLATSGIESLSMRELGVELREVDLGKSAVYGDERLKELLSQRYNVPTSHILLTTGSSLAIFLMCASLLKEGDEVIVENPTYPSLLKVPQAFGVKIKRIERKFEKRFALDLNLLDGMINKKTRMVVLTNLHNPSGMKLDDEHIIALLDRLKFTGTYLLIDEVYRDFLFNESPSTAHLLGERIISVSSLTKVYGMGGVRVGWAFCEPKIVKRALEINNHLGVNNSCLSEKVGILALERMESLIKRTRKIVQGNGAILKRWLKGRRDLEYVWPDGGVVIFPKLRSGLNSQLLTELLRRKFDTLIVPGNFFGFKEHIRIGFGCKTFILVAGLKSLGEALDELSEESGVSPNPHPERLEGRSRRISEGSIKWIGCSNG